jgi:hypothetical protein
MNSIPTVSLSVVYDGGCTRVTHLLKDSRLIIESSLYRERIPSELRNIISLYYGVDGLTEHLIYPLAVEKVYNMIANTPGLSLSPIDLSEDDFTSEINYYFGFTMCHRQSMSEMSRCNYIPINPIMFYKYYLEKYLYTNVPKRNKNSFPRLPVPRIRNSVYSSDEAEYIESNRHSSLSLSVLCH